MEKALLLAVLTVGLHGIASGQFCQLLPQPSEIAVEFSIQLSRSDLPTDGEFYYNCIAYDGESQNFKQTTVTVRYIMGSSVFSAQATYVCGYTGSDYLWAIGSVTSDAGTPTNQSTVEGCSNCMSTTTITTCTPCDGSACQNGMSNIYCTGCVCYDGYTGANCTMDIDECALDLQPACEGGANCTNTDGSFICTCPDPCMGDCNACCSSPCKKGGTCTSDNPNTFTCACPPGFTGETCIEFEGGCYSNPCLNDGVCSEVLDVNNPLAYRCSCPIGFTGYNCETRIDYCATQPCMNSGWCTSETTGFTCTCLQGFTGMICEQPLQTCRTDLSACGDNGYCSTRTGTTTTASYCSCYPGYIGETCNQVMTSCDTTTQAPCLHQGTCNQTAGGSGNVSFSCGCTGDWRGFYCTDCGIQWCVNGRPKGDCSGCTCNDYWSGDTCETCDRVYDNGICREPDCASGTQTCIFDACDIDYCKNCTDNVCYQCQGNITLRGNACATSSAGTTSDSNTAETVGIVLGCVAGAVIIVIIVFVLLFIALRYIQLSGIASMKKEDPTLIEKQQARLSGFFAPKSQLFGSGGHTGGIRTGVQSSYPSYKEMLNEASPSSEYENDKPAATSDPVYDDVDVNPDDEWLPPPDD